MEDSKMNENHLAQSETIETLTTSQYFGTPNDMVERHNHCPFCGGNLHFTHLTDFSKNLTQETAKCPECSVKVRNVIHRLQ